MTHIPQPPTCLQLLHLAPVIPVLQDPEEQEHGHLPAQQRGLVVSKATQDTAQGKYTSQSLCLAKQPGVGHTCVTPSAQDAP